MKLIGVSGLALVALILTGTRAHAAESPARPNILIILVDDMGWGDPQCFNPQSKIATPDIHTAA